MLRSVGLTSVVAALSVSGVIAAAAAQETRAVAECRSISDSLQRLVCYDAIEIVDGEQGAGSSSTTYRSVAINDFKVDADDLLGVRVSVRGSIMSMGSLSMLTSGAMDTIPIMIDTEGLPRDQRLQIVEHCSGGCRVTVEGLTQEVFFEAGIRAERVMFD